MKAKFLIIALFSLCFVQGQNADESLKIRKSIDTFFEGLHKGDTAIIKKVLNKNVILQTSGFDKEGKSVLRSQEMENFLNAVAGKDPKDIWEEKLLSYEILFDDNLASVWTPYKFYRNGVFSHCGVNSFQFFKNNGHWEMIYIIDTRRTDRCEIVEK